ncbi:MAG: pyruvate:ferredoxin (flavodoxin) oxidoreductase [Clostridiales bacterium]|nr:pyruvate:ferredoxin (flavodoxin) oxidoreductase [Clostridiales bacterium]
MPRMQTMDGNQAAAEVSYAFTEVAGIFPITPSSPMAEHVDEDAARGKKNIFGQTVKVVEMQSEAGAAGTVHGSLSAGALTTTYTASQGLLLMIPDMYKIAGELLPCVIHVSARCVASHALNIFGDHSDVMACRATGFAMLASSSVQQVMDLGAVAHLSAIKGKVPFLHFFDGFRTSHEIQKIELLDYDDLANLVDKDAVKEFKAHALNPEHPVTRGTAQNPDIFFQAREACNPYYDNVPAVVEEYMAEISKITGRDYQLFNYYGAPDAEKVIVAMGSVCDCIEETIDYLTAKGEKVGLVNVHLYRPFVADKFLAAIPKTAKKIAVLDRTKEPGSQGEPLYLDVCTAFYQAGDVREIVGGRYGLGSKDTTPAHILSVYENLDAEKPINGFTIAIKDDVTNLSLEAGPEIDVTGEHTISCKFWGLGSDGTVGANKNSIKIIGDHTDMYAQAYFEYDSKKSGGLTISHLRFGKDPIRSPYYVKTADFVALHQQSYLTKYDVVSDIKPGGKFLLNTIWSDEELNTHLPAAVKKAIAEKNIELYTINAVEIGKELGLGSKFNAVLQAAFFDIANIIPREDAVDYMKQAIKKTYGRKGDAIVNMNYNAVDAGISRYHKVEIPADWADAVDAPAAAAADRPDFIKNVCDVMNAANGDSLPVSAFKGIEDGTFIAGTAAYEKRGIAIDVPVWDASKCIECNQCSYICPHAAIRPFLLTDEEVAASPAPLTVKPAMGIKEPAGLKFKIQVDVLDCLGCGNCVDVCPAKESALKMVPIDSQRDEIPAWDYLVNLPTKANPLNKSTVKGSQFEKPLFEFSGACAGCGETPYAKLITQLFGDRMYVANATGCSSIWGGSAPTTPYTTNDKGQGPAWCNSLFEDNAEFGLGMYTSVKQQRELVKMKAEALIEASPCDKVKAACAAWIDTMFDGDASKATSASLVEALEGFIAGGAEGEAKELAEAILEAKDQLVKKSQWIFGGDGWAYDIGYGGLDHVLASGEDVNVFVFDTEVYSNTGGQASKSTPRSAIAKFAASGKKIRKKDLGMMAMSYGYVYVAQVNMGYDKSQLIKALVEAESYHGPSLVIGYAPCINHGIKMNFSQREAKRAVECGYWQNYRYNPTLEAEGKNPFSLDSKEPKESFQDFIKSEVRYNSLARQFPDTAQELFEQCEADAVRRLNKYKELAAK